MINAACADDRAHEGKVVMQDATRSIDREATPRAVAVLDVIAQLASSSPDYGEAQEIWSVQIPLKLAPGEAEHDRR
jgi:hypothetical protein